MAGRFLTVRCCDRFLTSLTVAVGREGVCSLLNDIAGCQLVLSSALAPSVMSQGNQEPVWTEEKKNIKRQIGIGVQMNSVKSPSEITRVMITQSSQKEGCYFKKWNFTKKEKSE